MKRLSPQIEKDIIRTASERPTYGYGRVWDLFRNNGTKLYRKIVRRALKERNLALLYAKHNGRIKSRNLLHLAVPG